MLKGKITTLRSTILILVLSLSGMIGLHGQWLEGYSHRMKITIDETMIPGVDPLIGFPMLFSYTDTILKSLGFGGVVNFADGRDIRFTGPDRITILEDEIEHYDPVTGTLVAWIRIPFFSATADSEIYIYFGDPAESPRPPNPEVWGNQFTAVWHMNTDPSETAPQIIDATSFLNHGTTGGTMTIDDLVEGKISGGIDFDGVDDYATMPVSGFNTDSGTVELWMNLDSIPLTNSEYFFAHRQENPITDRTYLRVWETGAWGTGMGNSYDLVRGSNLDTATWHHMAITWDGDEVSGYLDGALDFGPVSYAALDTVREIFIMTWMPSSESADGTLDELRVSSVPRDSGWIVAAYRNQDQPGSYLQVNPFEEYTDLCDEIPQLSFQVSSITCFEKNDGSIITTISGGTEPYTSLWSGPGGFSSTEPMLYDLAPGSYSLVVTDVFQCADSAQDIMISQPDQLVATVEQVTHLTSYEANDGSILLSVVGGTPPYAFSWTSTDQYESVEQNAMGLTVGHYDVRVSDAQDCQVSVLKTPVIIEFASPEVFIPEGFSPNGDGYNDYFVIVGIEEYPDTELQILNAQGVTLYHSPDYRNEWDGRPVKGAVLGDTLPEGTYYYVLKFAGGSAIKGFIYLNRE